MTNPRASPTWLAPPAWWSAHASGCPTRWSTRPGGPPELPATGGWPGCGCGRIFARAGTLAWQREHRLVGEFDHRAGSSGALHGQRVRAALGRDAGGGDHEGAEQRGGLGQQDRRSTPGRGKVGDGRHERHPGPVDPRRALADMLEERLAGLRTPRHQCVQRGGGGREAGQDRLQRCVRIRTCRLVWPCRHGSNVGGAHQRTRSGRGMRDERPPPPGRTIMRPRRWPVVATLTRPQN